MAQRVNLFVRGPHDPVAAGAAEHDAAARDRGCRRPRAQISEAGIDCGVSPFVANLGSESYSIKGVAVSVGTNIPARKTDLLIGR